VLISSIAFLTWISAHTIFDRTIWNTLGWLRGQIEEIPRVEEVETLLQTTGLDMGDQVVLALKMYADNLVLVALAGIGLLIVARMVLLRREEGRKLFILSMPFLVSGPAWVLIFATTLMVTMGRLLGSNVMMWATPVFAAYALHEIMVRWQRVRVPVSTAILIGAAVAGALGVYHSPFILQASWHITEQDNRGVEWLNTYGGEQRQRKQYANLGVPFLYTGLVRMPDHFGYHRQQTLGAALDRDALIVLTTRARLTVVHEVLADLRISDPRIKLVGADFQRLEQDPTVSRIYSGGEFEVLRAADPADS
jgi:hypothetical protein